MSLPEDDFAERSRSIFERLRAAQEPTPDETPPDTTPDEAPRRPEDGLTGADAPPAPLSESGPRAGAPDEVAGPALEEHGRGEPGDIDSSTGVGAYEAADARDVVHGSEEDEEDTATAEPATGNGGDPEDRDGHAEAGTPDIRSLDAPPETAWRADPGTDLGAADEQAAPPPPRDPGPAGFSAAPVWAPAGGVPGEDDGASASAAVEEGAPASWADDGPASTDAPVDDSASAATDVPVGEHHGPEGAVVDLTERPLAAEAESRPLPDPSRFVRPLPRVLAVANQKGGVGKTTTTVNLGASLAVLGYRVLVIDLDPQGNATTGLGINSRNLDTSIYDVILHDTPLEDCVEPTSLRNLFVAPATIDLAGAEIELVPAFSRELRLRRALQEVKGDYDFVLVDCPPSLGLLTVNALSAATEVLVPIQCEYYALEGLGQLLRNVNLVQSNLNPTLELNVIVLTMYDARTKLAEQVADEVREHFGDRVCRNVVPRTVRLSEAPSFGQPIIVFDPSSRGALAYRELAKEVSGGPPQRSG